MADGDDEEGESPIIAYVLATATLLAAACLMCICLMCCAKCPEWRRRIQRERNKEKCLKYCSKVKYSIQHNSIKKKTPCDSCAICLDDFLDKELIIICPCTHGYHKKCICDWLVHSPSCPICKEYIIRGIIPSDDTTPLLT